MAEAIAAILGSLLTFALGLAVFAYKNRISYELTTISSRVVFLNGDLIAPADGARSHTLNSERLTFTNEGFRTLRDVRLHLERTATPITKSVASTSAISAAAVEINAGDDYLEIVIPTFPSKEKVTIEWMNEGLFVSSYRELRGTGGAYKVVKVRSYKNAQSAIKAVIELIVFGLAIILIIKASN